MTAPANPLTLDRWVSERLAADAPLQALVAGRVYSDVAPLGTPSPWVVFSLQSSADVRGVGPATIMQRNLVLVRVTGVVTSYADLEPILQRVDAALHGSSGTVTSGTVLSVLRQESVRFTETADGQQYRHLGGLYEFLIQ